MGEAKDSCLCLGNEEQGSHRRKNKPHACLRSYDRLVLLSDGGRHGKVKTQVREFQDHGNETFTVAAAGLGPRTVDFHSLVTEGLGHIPWSKKAQELEPGLTSVRR